MASLHFGANANATLRSVLIVSVHSSLLDVWLSVKQVTLSPVLSVSYMTSLNTFIFSGTLYFMKISLQIISQVLFSQVQFLDSRKLFSQYFKFAILLSREINTKIKKGFYNIIFL